MLNDVPPFNCAPEDLSSFVMHLSEASDRSAISLSFKCCILSELGAEEMPSDNNDNHIIINKRHAATRRQYFSINRNTAIIF